MRLRQAVLAGLVIFLLVSATGAELSMGAEVLSGAKEQEQRSRRESEAAGWTRTARIATPYDYDEWTGWEDAVDRTVADGANVILDWADFSDTYLGWVLDPGAELPFLADHHGQNDDTIDWETQGIPWYPALEDGHHGFVGVFDGAGHGWPGFVADSSVFALTDFNFRRDESFPALSNASNSDDPATSTGCRNCYLEWSSSWNNFAGPPTDTADLYELVIRTNDGGQASVDITPRRLQQFVVTPGHSYAWENERLSDSGIVQSGTVVADSHGLITVPAFAVSPGGNRLRLEPAEPVNLTADSPANDQNPAWSPDGTRLVFTSGRSGNNELWLMDDDGGNPTALTSNGAENVNLPGRAWCAGNDRIVFASDVESVNDEIYSIASDGTGLQRLTTTDALNWEPSWSPDCSQIVFQSDRSGNWDLWRMNANGSSPVQLTADPADDWEPNWSPDGTTIVFQSLRSGNWDLWTMDYGTPEECGGDACDPYKGYHAYPYEPQILFYDPEELKEVLAGTRQPWEVVPYEVYRPLNEVLDPECATLGAAAYDRERGLIYVTEREAGPWGETMVHVWEVQ